MTSANPKGFIMTEYDLSVARLEEMVRVAPALDKAGIGHACDAGLLAAMATELLALRTLSAAEPSGISGELPIKTIEPERISEAKHTGKYVLAPLDPTIEMIDAGDDRQFGNGPDIVRHIYQKMLAALISADWLDIATAPKDGTWVDLWRPPVHGGVFWQSRVTAMWSDEDGAWVWPDSAYDAMTFPSAAAALIENGDFYADAGSFTHWKPLPTPPAALNGAVQ